MLRILGIKTRYCMILLQNPSVWYMACAYVGTNRNIQISVQLARTEDFTAFFEILVAH